MNASNILQYVWYSCKLTSIWHDHLVLFFPDNCGGEMGNSLTGGGAYGKTEIQWCNMLFAYRDAHALLFVYFLFLST